MAALRELTLGQLLDEAVEKWPDQEAVVYVDRDFARPTRNSANSWTPLPKG